MDPRQAQVPLDPRAAVAQGPAPIQLPEGGPDNPEVMVKIIIPDEKAFDISQGGVNHHRLKQIQANCNVHVRLASPGCFFPGSGDERAALVTGFAESVRVAIAQLLEVVEDDPSNPLVHLALPSAVVSTVLLAGGGQASKHIGNATHTQISVLPPLANFDETVLRIARFSRTPEAPVACVANSALMIVRIIMDADPNFQFNTVLNYDLGPGFDQDQVDEYPGLPFLSPQDAAMQRIELIKNQLAKLARGQTGHDNAILEREWNAQERAEEADIEHYRSLPPPAPVPPSLDVILANAAEIASTLPQILQIQCMVRIPRINNKQASAIIGVKGANIRDIQEASGCKIKIIDSPDAVHTGGIGPSATDLKEVVVTGHVNQVHGGLMGIAELMNEADHGATEAVSNVSAWLRQQTQQHARQPSRRPFEDSHSDYDRKRGRRF